MLYAAGIRLNLRLGKDGLRAAPDYVIEAWQDAEIALSDRERSGFALRFNLDAGNGTAAGGVLAGIIGQRAGRSIADYDGLKPQSRVVISAVIGPRVTVLMDGYIEEVRQEPGSDGTAGTLMVLGHDLTAVMQRSVKTKAYPGMTPGGIATAILAEYAGQGILADTSDPPGADRDDPQVHTPMQDEDDLSYLTRLASGFGYVFTLKPGPLPGVSTAYWGPARPDQKPQPPISVDMGPDSNATDVGIAHRPSAATAVAAEVRDPASGLAVPINAQLAAVPALAVRPAISDPAARSTQNLTGPPGQSPTQAMAQAAGQSQQSPAPLEVTGQLDMGRYGRALEVGRLVGLRGVGLDMDGQYIVQDVVHQISRGSWQQEFTLIREGTGSTVAVLSG